MPLSNHGFVASVAKRAGDAALASTGCPVRVPPSSLTLVERMSVHTACDACACPSANDSCDNVRVREVKENACA